MEQDREFNILISNTYTADDVYRRLSLARQFVESEFFSGKTHEGVRWRVVLEKFLTEHGAPPGARAALSHWGEGWFSAFTVQNFKSKFEKLESLIEALPKLALFVAVELPGAEVSRLGQWCRVNVDPLVLIEIHADPDAVGGTILAWQGVYRDLSIRNYFNEHRSDLLELIHTYGRTKQQI